MANTTKPVIKERVPVGGPRNILTVANKEPGYVYRWVNDSIPGRLEQFKQGGYEVVEDAMKIGDPMVDRPTRLGSATTVVRGTSTLVLMRIKQEWYDADQAAKQESIDDLEASMKPDEIDYGNIKITRK